MCYYFAYIADSWRRWTGQLSHELLEERAAVLGARGFGKLPLAQLFSSSPRAPTATCLPPPAAPATGPYRAPAGEETLLEL
jgi:hypothetical protein